MNETEKAAANLGEKIAELGEKIAELHIRNRGRIEHLFETVNTWERRIVNLENRIGNTLERIEKLEWLENRGKTWLPEDEQVEADNQMACDHIRKVKMSDQDHHFVFMREKNNLLSIMHNFAYCPECGEKLT